MDDGSLTSGRSSGAARPSGWKLDPAIAAQVQGLVVSGFSNLPTGKALLLTIGDAPDGGGRWLKALADVAPITPAVPGDRSRSAALAFAWSGLQKMGMAETALASFLPPYREGMMQEDRLRRLGDRRKEEWLDTVQDGGPVWSANTPAREKPERPMRAYAVDRVIKTDQVETPLTVHAILMLYTLTEADAEGWATEVLAALAPFNVTCLRQIGLTVDVQDNTRFGREHFGFADGLSQPKPFDVGGAVLQDGVAVTTPDRVQGVPLGEILLGYLNGHQEVAPGPVVPGDQYGLIDPRPAKAGLPPHQQAQGFFDFGLNGSYLVVRELRQDVAAFWQSMDENAAAIRAADPQHSAHVTADWLAERVVGRGRDGALLCPGGAYLPPDANGDPDNGYLFLDRDPRGLGCPLGSHVRRAHPRDSLAPSAEQGPTLLASANNHRILRRGRKYGPKIEDMRKDDKTDRGLLFMALNTDIARQFEFIQHTWLLNSSFATLFQEVDPLMGPEGRMTIPEDPLRRTIKVKTFVQMAGGDYFFLPSLPALAYLALL